MPRETSQPNSDSGSVAQDQFEQAASSKMNASPQTEQSLWRGGYSAKAMYGIWLLSVIGTIAGLAALVYFGSQHELIWPIGGSIIALWWCYAIALYLYRRLSTHYELTNQRFIHQAGILVRRTDRIEVIDIDDVSFTQGIIQRMLGVGTIKLTSSDRTHPELQIRGIDKVQAIAGQIDDVRRDERRRRSLHIEAI